MISLAGFSDSDNTNGFLAAVQMNVVHQLSPTSNKSLNMLIDNLPDSSLVL